ncbi:MAG: Gfo/Idh/MocA family oxidoreductase [Planctomycetes bacterium]|nr:Gfo/Idh/MocA family oxidoreductase [Planctomycetota bacterium]
MSAIPRRDFLKTTTSITAAAAIGLSPFGKARADANDTIRAAVIGLHGRGGSHVDGFQHQKGVEVAALCDVDENVLEKAAREFEKRTGKKVATYTDLRRLLEDKSIDVVGIATPNHWHSLAAIWACQAEKDVYVEKPCSHNIFEGRQLVNAAQYHKRIVQHGTQIRSSEAIREAMKLLQEGVIGDVYLAKGLCYKRRNSIGRTKEEPPPKGVHYDLWLGPAPARPFTRNRFHYNWHWHWDYGNGDIGNQGVHQMDIARWGLGVGLPEKAQSMGGHFLFDDDQETPNTQIAAFGYPGDKPHKKKMLVFEVRHWLTNLEGGKEGKGGIGVGNLFLGSEGTMEIPSYSSYRVFLGEKREPGPSREAGGDHFANFIAAVRQRDPKILNAPIEEGHLTSALCHLANVAYRLGRTLTFNPKAENFNGDAEANALLTRDYRKPFEVPGTV